MKPLVSFIVITYNSSKFIIDTLESARLQTYPELELVISDDASSDNTVALCEEWLRENKNRFAGTKIITSPVNTGITGNYNRGIKAAAGRWIKPLAGDDALLPTCIEDNVNYVLDHPDVKVLYSYNRVYLNDFKEENFLKLTPNGLPVNIITPEITPQEQYNKLLAGDRIPFTPSLFLNRETLLQVGLPDEDLFSEHYQTLLKLTRSGNKLHFMEKETVKYRQHENASNNTSRSYILKPHYFKTENFRERYIYPNIPSEIRRFHRFSWRVNQVFRIELFNRKNRFTEFLFYFLNTLINPYKYSIYFKSHFIRKYRNNSFYEF